MKKILLALMLAIGLAACDSKGTPAVDGKPTIKIGVLATLTGNVSDAGINGRQAIEQAREDIKDSPINFEFVVEDYGFEARKAAMSVNKLINIDKIDALIAWSSVAANVAAPIADSANIINIGITNELNAAKGKYNFISWTPSSSYVQKILKQINELGGIKSVAIFASYQNSMQQSANAVENVLKEHGIEVIRENFAVDHSDFTLMIEKMKAKDLDAWLVCAISPSSDVFVKRFFQQKVNKPLLAIDSYMFIKDLTPLEGYTFVTSPDAKQSLLNQIYKKTGIENPFSIGYSYDAAKILMDAYNYLYTKNNKMPSVDEVSSYLLSIKEYDGATGMLSINKDGVIISDAVIKQIKDGKAVLVEEK